MRETEQDGEDGERRDEARGHADREEQAEPEDAAVVGDHEAAEADDGGEAVEEHGHDGAARDERAAVVTPFHEAQHHVESELRGGAEDEWQPEDIAHRELQSEERHQSDRPQEPQAERHQREDGLADPPQHQEADAGDEDDRVERRLPIRALHQHDALVRDDRRTGHVAVDGPQLSHEAPRAVELPDVDRGTDADQEESVAAHELFTQLHRQILEADFARREVALQALEVAEEIPIDLVLQER